MSKSMHVRKTPLSHTTSRLILIEAEIDHKDGKTRSHNTTTLPKLELETFG